MNDEYLAWGFGLLGAAVVFAVIELFIPSFGILAISAALCALAGVVMIAIENLLMGILVGLALVVLLPIGFAFWAKVFPHTIVGRWIILGSPETDEETRQERQRTFTDQRLALLGAEGEAITDLRPVGVVRIDGDRHDALSDGPHIPAGARVRVVVVESNQVKVRQVT